MTKILHMEWIRVESYLNLENKDLVEVNSDNGFRMHDNLRDLERDVAVKRVVGLIKKRLQTFTAVLVIHS